jgi:hypothetical protein
MFMQKSKYTVVLVLALALVACGGEAAPEPTPTPEPEQMAPTATTPPPAPTSAPTATEDTGFEQASAFAGEWSGSWENTTFGSSGDARAAIDVQPDGTATFTVDLDGMVFGMLDPDPMTYEGTYDANGATFEAPGDPLFGDLAISVTPAGDVTINGELVPVDGIASLSASGTISSDSIQLEYTVVFTGGGEAMGVLNLVKES